MSEPTKARSVGNADAAPMEFDEAGGFELRDGTRQGFGPDAQQIGKILVQQRKLKALCFATIPSLPIGEA